MKICIPLETDQGQESRVAGHLGSAPLFGLVETESGELEIVPNPELAHRQGSCHPGRGLSALNVDAVVCQGVGRRAFASLSGAGIDVLIPPELTIPAITEAVRAGNVRRMSLDDACGGGRHGGHGQGHGRGPGEGCGQGHRHGYGHGQGRR